MRKNLDVSSLKFLAFQIKYHITGDEKRSTFKEKRETIELKSYNRKVLNCNICNWGYFEFSKKKLIKKKNCNSLCIKKLDK